MILWGPKIKGNTRESRLPSWVQEQQNIRHSSSIVFLLTLRGQEYQYGIVISCIFRIAFCIPSVNPYSDIVQCSRDVDCRRSDRVQQSARGDPFHITCCNHIPAKCGDGCGLSRIPRAILVSRCQMAKDRQSPSDAVSFETTIKV